MEDKMEGHSPSLKKRLKHTICGCFNHHHHHHQMDDPSTTHKPMLTRSSSGGAATSGFRSYRSGSEELSHIKDKCRNLISRMGTPRGNHHRKSRSTDFGYDPLSYALNFDQGCGDDDGGCLDEFPLRNFSARLPPSPPPHLHRQESDAAVTLPFPPPSPSKVRPPSSEITAA